MKFFSDIRLLLIGVWLGAAVFFIAVAQASFAVLADHEMAGAVVGRTLAMLNYSGIGIAVLLLLTSLLGSARIAKFWLWVERLLLVILAAACAIGQFVVVVWLDNIKGQMGQPVEQVATDDPLRMQFEMLHHYSEWLLVAGMIAAFITFFILSNRKFGVVKPAAPAGPYDFSKEFKT